MWKTVCKCVFGKDHLIFWEWKAVHSFMFNKLFLCGVFQSERLYLEVMLPTARQISRYYSRISFQNAVLFRLLSRQFKSSSTYYIRIRIFTLEKSVSLHLLIRLGICYWTEECGSIILSYSFTTVFIVFIELYLFSVCSAFIIIAERLLK